ncbi:MAG: hypothetical protein V3T53_01370 [Phycisphaerales bacterium]
MKNSCKLIPLALMIAALACAMAPTAAHSTTQTSGARADDGIRLWQAIAQAPPEVEAIAEVLGFERFAYVPPRLYTRWNPKRFDRARFDANLAEIKAICHGADWIGTDLEKEPREIIRHPDDYESHEIDWAKAQYTTMWAAFREVFPDAKLLEYNWPSGRRAGHFPLMDKMAVRHLDALSPSVFWSDHPNWPRSRSERIAHALELGREHDMPVVPWVFARHKVKNGQTVTYKPVPATALAAMLDLATTDGVAGLIVWSNVYSLLKSADPRRVIAETRRPDYERVRVDAWTVFVLGQTRIRR